MLLLLIGATHSTDLPPNTRMFMLVPWFSVVAALGAQWMARHVRGLIGGIFALNLYQAYDTSIRPPAGFLEFDGLFVRLAQNLNVELDRTPRSIAFVYDPSRHHIPSLEREFPLLASEVRSRFQENLFSNQWLECSMLSVFGQPRFSVWYAPNTINPCETPRSGLPLRLPEPLSLGVLAVLLGGAIAGLVYARARFPTQLEALTRGEGLPALVPANAGWSFSKRRLDEPAPPPAATTLAPPGAAVSRGFTIEFSFRVTLRGPGSAPPPAASQANPAALVLPNTPGEADAPPVPPPADSQDLKE
jgi:hypothetical protein